MVSCFDTLAADGKRPFKMESVMEPVFAVEPEFDLFNPQAVAAPVRRSWYFLLVPGDGFVGKVEAVKYLLELVVERLSVFYRIALIACPGTNLASKRAGSKIGIIFLVWRLQDFTSDPDLVSQFVPMEQGAGFRVFFNFYAFDRVIIGVENDVAFVSIDFFAQYHSCIGHTFRIGCGNCHSIRIGLEV